MDVREILFAKGDEEKKKKLGSVARDENIYAKGRGDVLIYLKPRSSCSEPNEVLIKKKKNKKKGMKMRRGEKILAQHAQRHNLFIIYPHEYSCVSIFFFFLSYFHETSHSLRFFRYVTEKKLKYILATFPF